MKNPNDFRTLVARPRPQQRWHVRGHKGFLNLRKVWHLLASAGNAAASGGGRGYGRVAVDKSLTLRSMNGPRVTIIDGGGSLQCVCLTDLTNTAPIPSPARSSFSG